MVCLENRHRQVRGVHWRSVARQQRHIGKDESISQSFLSVMPLGGDDFYWRNSGDPGFNDYDKSSADYYVEALPGTEGTVSFDERSFVWHHTDSAQRSGLTITVEDFYDIAGFTQYRYTSGGQVYRPSHEGPTYNGAEFYYTRNSYTIDFYVDSEKLDSETVAYEAPISQALDDNIPSTRLSRAIPLRAGIWIPNARHRYRTI